jgi:hypothetical protein
VLSRFLLTVATAVAFFLFVGRHWNDVWILTIYSPGIILGLALLSLLPLCIQLARRSSGSRAFPLHPALVTLPLCVLSVPLLWSLGERVACEIPALCAVVAGEKVSTDRRATFSVHLHGWGNPELFEFSSAIVVFTGQRRFEDLYVELPKWEAHYTNTYTTEFPLTRGSLLEYVKRSDDFAPAEAEKIADRLWEVLRKYAEKRELPPFQYGFSEQPHPKVVYYVPPWGVYRGTVAVAAPFLLVIACLLTLWHVGAAKLGPCLKRRTERESIRTGLKKPA